MEVFDSLLSAWGEVFERDMSKTFWIFVKQIDDLGVNGFGSSSGAHGRFSDLRRLLVVELRASGAKMTPCVGMVKKKSARNTCVGISNQ